MALNPLQDDLAPRSDSLSTFVIVSVVDAAVELNTVPLSDGWTNRAVATFTLGLSCSCGLQMTPPLESGLLFCKALRSYLGPYDEVSATAIQH